MRAKAIIRPPLRASAPPERPVPAPRPTMGMSCCAASLTTLGDFFRGARKDDDVGAAFFNGAVVFVEEHDLPGRTDRAGAKKLFEFANRNLRHKWPKLGQGYVHYRE